MTLKKKLRNREYRETFAFANLRDSISAQIFTLRKQRGWTQAELAKRANMTQSRIAILEGGGNRLPSLMTLHRLATVFDLAPVFQFELFENVRAALERGVSGTVGGGERDR